jgi:ADP-heptose:LPS heptosyltransferase
MGDDLMCSAVARELKKRGTTKIWLFTSFPELFAHNPDLTAVPYDFRLQRLCRFFGVPCVKVAYPRIPTRHLITTICAAAGITGEVELRPHIVLSEEERRSGKVVPRPQIAMQTSCLAAKYPMRNKQWPHERFQIVADALKDDFDLIQLGSPSDPELVGALDLRGKTTLRQAAAILAASHLFIGLVTGLMHIARAVECRSVIVFGGREHPSQSGYTANENLYWDGPCAPCWLGNDCSYHRRCMSEIVPEAVIAAVRLQADRFGTPLVVDLASTVT